MRGFWCGILLVVVVAVVSLAYAGESVSLHEGQKIEGEVLDIRYPETTEGSQPYLVLVRAWNGQEEQFQSYKRPLFGIGQTISWEKDRDEVEIIK